MPPGHEYSQLGDHVLRAHKLRANTVADALGYSVHQDAMMSDTPFTRDMANCLHQTSSQNVARRFVLQSSQIQGGLGMPGI